MAAEQVRATRQESSILAVRTKLRFEAVTTLKNEGMGIRMIVRQLGLARDTVRRFYCASSVDCWAPRAGQLCWTVSPSTCTSASTTDTPPLLHFTKNFKYWDIAAATALSATT